MTVLPPKSDETSPNLWIIPVVSAIRLLHNNVKDLRSKVCAMTLWQWNGSEFLSAVGSLDQHKDVFVIDSIELHNPRKFLDRFIRLTGSLLHRGRDPVVAGDVLGADLHDASGRV